MPKLNTSTIDSTEKNSIKTKKSSTVNKRSKKEKTFLAEPREIVEQNLRRFQLHEKDTGSVQLQVVRLSDRIHYLNSHFQVHNKDHHSRRGLIKMVSRRRKLLDYLKAKRTEDYQSLLEKLNIRK